MANENKIPQHITRREAIKAAAAAAVLPLLSTSPVRAKENAATNHSPTIGIATLGFGEYSNEQLARELAETGIHTVQLFLNQTDSRYWQYNGRSDVSDLTASRCQAIAEAYRSAGITIHSIGVYTNLIHPDETERNANLAYFEAMMKIGGHMGVRKFITEAGEYHSETEVPPVPYHFQKEVWDQMVKTAKKLAEMAQAHDATVLFEPFYRGFFASAKRTRLFLEEVDSHNIRALLDPANLIEINDVEEMFAQLGPWIQCLHAKDRKLHVDQGVGAGQGDLDYKAFVAAAAQYAPAAPFILEYVGPHDYQQALILLQDTIEERKI